MKIGTQIKFLPESRAKPGYAILRDVINAGDTIPKSQLKFYFGTGKTAIEAAKTRKYTRYVFERTNDHSYVVVPGPMLEFFVEAIGYDC